MQKSIRHIVHLGIGIVLVLLGIVGFFVPLLPQLIFLIPGLLLLAPHFRIARWALDKIELVVPKKYRGTFDKWEQWLEKRF